MNYYNLKHSVAWGQVWDNLTLASNALAAELIPHGAYFKKIEATIKSATLNKVRELAAAKYSKFDEIKTQLDPEILNQALAAGVAVVENEVVQSLAEGAKAVKLSPAQERRWRELDEQMIDILAESEKEADSNRHHILRLKYQRHEEARDGIKVNWEEKAKQRFLEAYKQELLRLFKNYHNIEPARELHAEIIIDSNPKGRK